MRFAGACLAALLALGSAAPANAAEQPRKLRMAFTSLSGSMAPPWAARDGGYFAKHGLDVEVIATPSGVEGMNALLAGELQFLHIAGGTTVSAAVGGGDVVILATTINTFVQNLVVRPEIESAEQLRGKALGISRFGTSIDTGARVALRHYGLVPEKDVAIVQIGAVESIVAAMQGNRVQAGILSYPTIARAKKLGNRVLLDIASLGVPYASTGITTTGKLLRSDPDLAQRYVTALVEAIARLKQDKPFATKVMSKYLRLTDPEMLSEAYDIYIQKHLLKVPLPTVEAIKAVLEELAPRNPKAQSEDPKKFYDDTIVRRLDASGFISRLYAK